MLSERGTILVLGRTLQAPEVMLYKYIQDAFASDDREEPPRWQLHSGREVHALRMVAVGYS